LLGETASPKRGGDVNGEERNYGMAHGIGIIGLGIMGERMLRTMREHPNFAVAAAWDPDDDDDARLAAIDGSARFARDAGDVAGDDKVDCLYIASPPSTHLAYADLAFDHGKAVFAEKPLAVDLASSRAAAARVERERRVAAVNFPFAAAPAARAVAAALKTGELGTIERVDIAVAFARWPRAWQERARWLALRRDGGFVREVLSHFLFLTQRLIGPLVIRECRVTYPDDCAAETAIAARLAAGAVPVTLAGRIGGDLADDHRWRVLGQQGAFEPHDWYSLKRRINGGWLDVDFGEGEVRDLSYRAQLDALDAMLAGRPHGLASFREALGVQECIEAMLHES
jgi:predicted dehydrogenase